MNKILIDSSVWISFFRGNEEANNLNILLDKNMVCINDLILSELIPPLMLKKENELIRLMNSIERLKMEIDWIGIIQIQVLNLKSGLNRVGIPDLIIAQNAIHNNVQLYSFDKHFELMKKEIGLKLFKS
jgi:predicted nucleic acid-binding protein